MRFSDFIAGLAAASPVFLAPGGLPGNAAREHAFRVDDATYGTPEGARPMDVSGSKHSGVIHVKKPMTLENGRHTVTATAYNKDGNIESSPLNS